MRTLLLLLTLCLPLSAAARTSVVVLKSDDIPAYSEPVDAFRRSIDTTVHVYEILGDASMAERVSKKLRQNPPPVIVALGAKAAYTATQEFPEIPVVYAMVDDPSRYGVEGPLVTGVLMDIDPILVVSEFKLFVPSAENIGIIVSVDNTNPMVDAAIEAADVGKYHERLERISSPRDVRKAFNRLRPQIDALWILPDREILTSSTFHYLRAEAIRAHLPMLVYSPDLVRAGGLMCVSPNAQQVGEQLAQITSQILDGANPATIPVLRPDQPQVVLNRDTQEALGLKIDPVLFDFVDEEVDLKRSSR